MSRAVQQRSADTELEASLRTALFWGLVRFEKKASGSSFFLLNPYIIWPSSSSSGWRAATKTVQEGAGGDGEWWMDRQIDRQTDSRKWGEKEDFSQAGRVFVFKVAEGHAVTNCCYCNNCPSSYLSSFGPFFFFPSGRLNYICFCVCVCASGRISTEHLTQRAVRPACPGK